MFSSLIDPPETMTFDGIKCREFAHFHADRSLRTCRLSHPQRIGGHKFKTGTVVTLSDGGELESAMIYEAHRLARKTYEAGSLGFDDSGDVESYLEGWLGD